MTRLEEKTFATSGPRIQVRFFAGYEFEDAKLSDLDLVKNAEKNNLSMGSTIDIEKGKKPKFLIWASADSLGAPLQNSNHKRLVRKWKYKEKVFDVACPDGLMLIHLTSAVLIMVQKLILKL